MKTQSYIDITLDEGMKTHSHINITVDERDEDSIPHRHNCS